MSEFQLDTSGEVLLPGHYLWQDLSPFVQGYVGALFASLQDRLCGASVTTSPGVGARRFSSKAVGHGGCTRTARFMEGRHFYCAQHAKEAPTPLRTASGKLRAGVRPIPLAFDMLAGETLARIIEDCDRAVKAGWVAPKGQNPLWLGSSFWAARQNRNAPTFRPQTLALGDDGKARFK